MTDQVTLMVLTICSILAILSTMVFPDKPEVSMGKVPLTVPPLVPVTIRCPTCGGPTGLGNCCWCRTFNHPQPPATSGMDPRMISEVSLEPDPLMLSTVWK